MTEPSKADSVAHTVLCVVGWGVLLPIGVVFARFKEYGVIWFQLHRACQTLGYVIGVAGVVVGFKMGAPHQTMVSKFHRHLGAAALALFTLNVLAVFWHPAKEPTRLRAAWQIGHWTVGGVGLALAIADVFIGFQVCSEVHTWDIVYAVGIGVIMLVWLAKLVLDAIRQPVLDIEAGKAEAAAPELPDKLAMVEINLQEPTHAPADKEAAR